MMLAFRAYGLEIHSNINLPLWPVRNGAPSQAPDILIELDGEFSAPTTASDQKSWSRVSAQGWEIYLQDVGAFSVKPGRPVRILARPLPYLPEGVLSSYLVGGILALAIHYHGYLPLHGAALQIGRKNVIFMGLSESGKSSLSAALCAMGHRILADDLSVVHWINGRAHVMPGYPRIKLHSDTIEAVDIPRNELVVLPEDNEKLGWLRPGNLFEDPQPIDCCFFLSFGERQMLPIAGLTAFAQIQRHAAPSQWCAEGGKQHFLLCSRLVTEVPSFRFIWERNLDFLMDQAKWVCQSIQGVGK